MDYKNRLIACVVLGAIAGYILGTGKGLLIGGLIGLGVFLLNGK